MYIGALSFLARQEASSDGIAVRYRLDGNLFILRRLKAVSKTQTSHIFELRYADDAAYISSSAEGLQHIIDVMGCL